MTYNVTYRDLSEPGQPTYHTTFECGEKDIDKAGYLAKFHFHFDNDIIYWLSK